MCLIFMVCIHMSYSLAYHLAHYQYQGVDKINDYDFLVVITLAKKLKNNQMDKMITRKIEKKAFCGSFSDRLRFLQIILR